MKTNRIIFLMLMSIFLVSCQNTPDSRIASIEETEKKLYGDTANPMNVTLARDAVKQYIDFADEFPGHEKSADYLFRAGQLAMSLMQSQDALNYFQRVYEKYPAYGKAPDCLFLQGFIYENQLKKLADAQRLYRDFLQKFPNHSLADDAEFSLKYLGKSEEDIIKDFEKNKPDSGNVNQP